MGYIGQPRGVDLYRYLINEPIELTFEEHTYFTEEIILPAFKAHKNFGDLNGDPIYFAKSIGESIVFDYKDNIKCDSFIKNESVTSIMDSKSKVEFSHDKMINLCKHYIRACCTNQPDNVIINLVMIMQQCYHSSMADYVLSKSIDWKRSAIAVPAMNEARKENAKARQEGIKLFHEFSSNSDPTKTEEAIKYINTNFKKWRRNYKNSLNKSINITNNDNINLIPSHFKKWFAIIYSDKSNHKGNNAVNRCNRQNKTIDYYFKIKGKIAVSNSYIRTYLSNI